MRTFVVKGGALAAAAVIAAGCGSASSGSSTDISKQVFGPAFGQVVKSFRQTSHDIGLAIVHAPSKTDAQIASTFSGLASQWQSNLTKLKALRPPPSVSAQYTTLVGAATRTQADLKSIVAAAQSHNASAAKSASHSLVTDILQAKSASQSITTKLGIS